MFLHVLSNGLVEDCFAVVVEYNNLVALKVSHNELDSDPLVVRHEESSRLCLKVVSIGEEVELCHVVLLKVKHKHVP